MPRITRKGLRNKMGIVPRAIAKCTGCQGSLRISPCVSYARNRIPIAYYGFTLRGTLLPLLVRSKSTSWTGATSVYSRDCESFIKHSRFCRSSCCKYSSNPLGPHTHTRARARANTHTHTHTHKMCILAEILLHCLELQTFLTALYKLELNKTEFFYIVYYSIYLITN